MTSAMKLGVIFEYPEDKIQPLPGVYAWKCKREGVEKFLYVGKSDNSTVLRGLTELINCPLTSNKGDTIDTDFVVNTTIKVFTSNGWECSWVHVTDDPAKEVGLCSQLKPILQDPRSATIKSGLRKRHPNGEKWSGKNTEHRDLAYRLIEDEIRQYLR